MFRAIGIILVLYALSHMMQPTFMAFQDAATASLQTLQAAAVVSKMQIERHAQ